MKHHDPSSHERPPQSPDDVVQAIRMAQQAIHQHKAARPKDKDACAEQVRERLAVLGTLLAEPLMRVAAGWTASGTYEDLILTRSRRDALEALAMSMFLNIIEALPTLHIDPQRNVVGLLLTIARRGAAKENKQVYGHAPSPTATANEDNPAPGTPAGTMAPPRESTSGVRGVFDSETHEQVEPVDPASIELEEQLLRKLHSRECWAALQKHWFPTLSRENRLILRARWFDDPPRPFEDIADLLGAGWTVPAVRQRMRRMLRSAAQCLRDLGLLE